MKVIPLDVSMFTIEVSPHLTVTIVIHAADIAHGTGGRTGCSGGETLFVDGFRVGGSGKGELLGFG